MVHHNNGVADARDRRFCARPSIIAGSCGREEPSEVVILCSSVAELPGAMLICFSPATPRTNGLSVAYDYDIIIDGGKPTCLDSTWPVRTCRAASRLFLISLDLCGCRVLVHATSPRGDLPNRIARLKRG